MFRTLPFPPTRFRAQPRRITPFPPGILPPDLNSEIGRVQREVQFIFNEARNEWRALPRPTLQGNPPTLRGSGYEAVEILGKLLNFDLNMSPLKNEACASCHMPYVAFSGPIPSVNLTMIAYLGTLPLTAPDKRTAMRYTYSPDFPQLQYDAITGTIWREFLGRPRHRIPAAKPDAEQAQHPPVDTGEMGFPDTACIAFRLSQPRTAPVRARLGRWFADFQWPADTPKICATPGGAAVFHGSATPISLRPADRTKANEVFNHWAESISAFEHSPSVSPFTSKFDAYLAGNYQLTPDEKAGYALFRGKANCNSCHLDGTSTLLKPGQVDTGTPGDAAPLFTCFGYANLGVPLNPAVALFYETKPDRYRVHAQPLRFRVPGSGAWEFPAQRLRRRPQSELRNG